MTSPEEYRITDEDRRRLGEIFKRRKRHGCSQRVSMRGLDSGAVSYVLEECGGRLSTAQLLVAAWLFENGCSTIIEASDATGASKVTVRHAFESLEDLGLVHSRERQTGTRGRNPVVYYPIAPEDDDD